MTLKTAKTFLILIGLVLLCGLYKSRAENLMESERFIAEVQRQHNELIDIHTNNLLAIKTALLNNKSAKTYLPNIDEAAELIYSLHYRYAEDGITATVILGLIETESNFIPKAVCYAPNGTSYGLMQITPETAKPYLKDMGYNRINKLLLFDPLINIMVGTQILHDYIQVVKRKGISQKNTLDYAFGVYNMGEGGFFRSIRNRQPCKIAKKYIALQHKNQQHWLELVKEVK